MNEYLWQIPDNALWVNKLTLKFICRFSLLIIEINNNSEYIMI